MENMKFSHIQGVNVTPIRLSTVAIARAQHLNSLGLLANDIGRTLQINPIQIRQWLKGETNET